MKILVPAFLLSVAFAPVSSALAAEAGVAVGPVGVGVHVGDSDRMREHRTVVVDHDRGRDCHMIVSRTRMGDRVVTKRIRKCD